MATAIAVIEENSVDAFEEIKTAWTNCKQAEKHGLEFGRICYEWQTKFKTVGGVGNKGKGIHAIWQKLSIPPSTAYRWIDAYMESQGIVRLHIEKRKNRSAPPDSFEVLRDIVKQAHNLGFKHLQETGGIDASHFDAAKTWAHCRIEEKEHPVFVDSSRAIPTQCLPVENVKLTLQTPAPVATSDSDIEDAVFQMAQTDKQDSTKTHLYDAASNPPAPVPAKASEAKPTSESQTKKLQRQFEEIANPSVGKIVLKASNVSSGVETSMGRYDLMLSGVTKPMLEKIRQVLAC